MLSLQRFEQDGIEILIDSVTGESFASVSSYARMSGKDKSVISRRLKTVALDDQKTAEIETVSGVKTVALIPESLIAEWLPKDNPEMASKLMLLGVRMFLYEIAGYNQSLRYPPAQPAPQRDTIQYIEAATALNEMPDSMLKLLLRDSLVDELELRRNQKSLPAPKKQYTIVKVRAKELGYSLAQIGSGASLGRFVRKRVDPVADDRVGLYKVYHYEVNDTLDDAIHEYFYGK